MSDQNQQENKAINNICPWSGKPVSQDSLTEYRGHTVGFCNPGCRDKFDAATRHFDRALSELDGSKEEDPRT